MTLYGGLYDESTGVEHDVFVRRKEGIQHTNLLLKYSIGAHKHGTRHHGAMAVAEKIRIFEVWSF
jgi:hypothetical protein